MNMYNMEISIGSHKCRLEICLLAFFLFWVMFGHVLCSCCTVSLQEGLAMATNSDSSDSSDNSKMKKMAAMKRISDSRNTTTTEGFSQNVVAKRRISDENSEDDVKEGFVSSNNKAYGPEFGASKSPGYIMRPDTWAMPTLSYSKGTTPSAGAQDILNRNNPPLAKGEMDLFANTPFKSECCPNTYSSSEGCACMDMQQYDMLIHRGSNNVPYSEY